MTGGGVTGNELGRRRFVQGGLAAAGLGAAVPLLAACGDGDDGDRGDDVPAADPLPADAPAATDE
ncbi:MAG: ABC transporter substrate-binding protein, partial [Acidimicrobiaceae bacterium]|nr:ABC transporter substrate-binding protein [Acidimicrobiaceae bacterium]